MYELMPELDKISKARIYHGQLNLLGEIVFEVIMGRSLRRNELRKLASNLPEILSFCEVDKSEIELVDAVIGELVENPANVSPIDLNKVYEIINTTKSELKRFVEEKTIEKFVETKRDQFAEYVDELKKYVLGDIHADREKKKEEILKIVYKSPGHYIRSLYIYLSKKYDKISYSAVWNYINELERDGKIITIGGPQGKFRYCFPNPEIVENRTIYYGKCFGIKGIVEELILDKFRTPELRGPFYSIYLVNSHIKPILLAIPFSVEIETEISISAYGELEPYHYLEKLGYLAQDVSLKLDVLLGWKLEASIDGKEVEILIDEEKAFIKPEF